MPTLASGRWRPERIGHLAVDEDDADFSYSKYFLRPSEQSHVACTNAGHGLVMSRCGTPEAGHTCGMKATELLKLSRQQMSRQLHAMKGHFPLKCVVPMSTRLLASVCRTHEHSRSEVDARHGARHALDEVSRTHAVIISVDQLIILATIVFQSYSSPSQSLVYTGELSMALHRRRFGPLGERHVANGPSARWPAALSTPAAILTRGRPSGLGRPTLRGGRRPGPHRPARVHL